jgi:hypothetical protein
MILRRAETRLTAGFFLFRPSPLLEDDRVTNGASRVCRKTSEDGSRLVLGSMVMLLKSDELYLERARTWSRFPEEGAVGQQERSTLLSAATYSVTA